MENNTNQAAQASAANTSYDQDSANGTTASTASNSQGGALSSITGALGNIQVPQAVKDFGATCARSYGGLSTTQKVVGGAVLALGASYWAASANGWIGQGKMSVGKKNKNKNAQHA